jgi:hypothetical protein
MPPRKAAGHVRPVRRVARRAPDPALVTPPPDGVLLEDDDPRVAYLWHGLVDALAGRADRMQWQTLVGAVELARRFYGQGTAAAWAEYRRTVREVVRAVEDHELTAAPAARRPGVRPL